MELKETTGYVAGFRPELNLRELGGLVGAGGRRIRRGLIFRSGLLFDFTPEELDRLHRLKLRYVLDLRSGSEAKGKPDPQISGTHMVRISGAMDAGDNEVNFSAGAIVGLLMNPRRKDDDPEESIESAVAEVYSSLAFNNIAYRALFDQLERGNAPLLFHCTNGKDRTGIAAMLVEMALGVSEDDMIADYILTNVYRDEAIQRHLRKHPRLAKVGVFDKLVRAAEGVLEHFGRRVFDEVRQEYGTFEAFLEAEYGLDAARLAALRERYLEPISPVRYDLRRRDLYAD